MIDWNQAINDYIKSKERQTEPSEPNTFRCSSLSGCIRSCVKTRTNQNAYGIETLKHFELGTILHRFLQHEVSVGFVNEPIQLEKRLELEADGIKLIGHADCVTEDVVFDFKSTANLQTTLSYPVSTGYIYQLSAYCHALHKEKAVVVYIDKRNLVCGQKEIAVIPLTQIISFCKEVILAEAHFKKTGELPKPCQECFSCRKESGKYK
jgi:hypothetical protein